MSGWVMPVDSKVFTRIKAQFPDELKTQYGMTDDNFSTKGSSLTDAKFPFVHVHLMGGPEQGQTMEGDSIEAGLFTFQIDVYDNKTQSRAKNVMAEIMAIMKAMRFQAVEMPELESSETFRCTARFRRAIGALDTF